MFPLFLFQPALPAADTTAATVKSFSLLDIIASGGILGILNVVAQVALALIAVYIIIERYFTIKRAGEVDDNFMNQIRSYVQNADIQAALTLCRNTDTPVARMVGKGLQRIGKPMSDIRDSVENVGNLEIYKLENRISMIATISGACPMIGFLGTVTGMIQAFYTMSSTNNVTPQALASGIYQALITTAFGLVVGIICFMAYNTFIASVDRVVFKMEAATLEFLDLLQEPA
jgi:biopolymer transport protein ExbB